MKKILMVFIFLFLLTLSQVDVNANTSGQVLLGQSCKNAGGECSADENLPKVKNPHAKCPNDFYCVEKGSNNSCPVDNITYKCGEKMFSGNYTCPDKYFEEKGKSCSGGVLCCKLGEISDCKCENGKWNDQCNGELPGKPCCDIDPQNTDPQYRCMDQNTAGGISCPIGYKENGGYCISGVKCCAKNSSGSTVPNPEKTDPQKADPNKDKPPVNTNPNSTNKTNTLPKPATDNDVSEFCRYNPTYADIQKGNLNSTKPGNEKVIYEKTIMSQEECNVWVRGTDAQYIKFKNEADPDTAKAIKSMMESIQSTAQAGSGVFTNISNTIKELGNRIAEEEKNIAQAAKNILAPAKNGTAVENKPVEVNTSSAGITTQAEYEKKCRENNPGIAASSFDFSLGQPGCGPGYIGSNLAFGAISTAKGYGIHCCIKVEKFFQECKGVARFAKDCKGRKTLDNGKFVCCSK